MVYQDRLETFIAAISAPRKFRMFFKLLFFWSTLLMNINKHDW